MSDLKAIVTLAVTVIVIGLILQKVFPDEVNYVKAKEQQVENKVRLQAHKLENKVQTAFKNAEEAAARREAILDGAVAPEPVFATRGGLRKEPLLRTVTRGGVHPVQRRVRFAPQNGSRA